MQRGEVGREVLGIGSDRPRGTKVSAGDWSSDMGKCAEGKVLAGPCMLTHEGHFSKALCAEEVEAGGGGAASELDGVCTAAFART